MKKVLSGLMLAALLATSMLFVNCSEDDSEYYSINKKSASTTESESVLIARCLKGSDAIELLFDVDTVARQTEDEIKHKYSTEIVVEEISVLDNNPNDTTYKSYMICSSFLPNGGISGKIATELVKYKDVKTGDVLYKIASKPKLELVCKGRNRKLSNGNPACVPISGENGELKGCTMCENSDGVCESMMKPAESFWKRLLMAICGGIKNTIDITVKI